MIKSNTMSSSVPGWDYPASYDYEDEIEDNPYAEDELKDRE